MLISKEVLSYLSDGDLYTKYEAIEYSTNLRDVVTVGYMMEHPLD
jgi:hypothetical protein